MSEMIIDVPQGVQPGEMLALTMPDGSVFDLAIPGHVQGGDQLTLEDKGNGPQIVKIIRGAPALASSTQQAPTQATLPPMPTQLASSAPPPERQEWNCTLQTTKGPLTIRICPQWAPRAAERFHELFMDDFFKDLPVYRAVSGFLVQFGVTKGGSGAGRYPALQDDVHQGRPIQKGSVCFAASGPNTRRATICIFLEDLPQFGKKSWETPFGIVEADEKSRKTLQTLHTGYGDIPQCGGNGPCPHRLEREGPAYIRSEFKDIDFVVHAYGPGECW